MSVNLKTNPTVECVVINYRRPENIPLILRRFREQSYPCTVTLIDQTGGLSLETYELAHRVYTLHQNYGPWNRYVPAGNYHKDFTYFHDSDMLPGREVVRGFLAHAERTTDGALFGQYGRICEHGYNFTDYRAVNVPVPVSLVIRGYFLKTEYLLDLLRFARHFEHPILEDDITLAWAIHTYTNKLIYLVPKPENPAELMNEEELPAPHACRDRSGHFLRRDNFWRQCEKISKAIKEIEKLRV